MVSDTITARLEKLGLSNYEARAYLASIDQPPMTGYMLSKLSGVPRSRIYETIEKLISKGLLVFQSGAKNLVAPLDFNTFLSRIEKENNESIKFLREKLPEIHKQDNECIWNLTGRERIFETLRDIISQARKHVYIAVNSTDFPLIEQSIQACIERDIPVWGIYFGGTHINIKNIFSHLGDSCVICNEIALSVDSKQAVIGSTWPANSALAALTRNKGFVYITEQYIKHEIFLNKFYTGKDKKVIKNYSDKYRDLMNQLP